MAAVCPPRRVLMEIPAPQPKIAARVRRSYLEILSSRAEPSARAQRGLVATRRTQSLDSARHRPLQGHQQEQEQQEEEEEEEVSVARQCGQTLLSNQQLVRLLRSFIIAEQKSQRPQTLSSDLKLLQEELQLHKACVYRSIPYSRLVSNRDAHCYRKAYPYLVAFKLSCQEGGRALLQLEDWDSALEHSLVAWRYTSELPQWDTSSHNALREQCFTLLAGHCATALRHLRLQPAKARQLMRRFKMAQVHSRAILPCIAELQRILGE